MSGRAIATTDAKVPEYHMPFVRVSWFEGKDHSQREKVAAEITESIQHIGHGRWKPGHRRHQRPELYGPVEGTEPPRAGNEDA
jgi:Tautomerase enzyme